MEGQRERRTQKGIETLSGGELIKDMEHHTHRNDKVYEDRACETQFDQCWSCKVLFDTGNISR